MTSIDLQSAIANATDEQIRAFLDAIQARPLTIALSRTTERRLREHLAVVNAELARIGEEPVGFTDEALATCVEALVDRALSADPDAGAPVRLYAVPDGPFELLTGFDEDPR